MCLHLHCWKKQTHPDSTCTYIYDQTCVQERMSFVQFISFSNVHIQYNNKGYPSIINLIIFGKIPMHQFSKYQTVL